MRAYQIICYLFFAFLLGSQWIAGIGCAQIVPPTGGPVDTLPPVLDTPRSTPNYQTNFEKQTIVLEFQEFIELKDVFTQVVVSPPPAKRPEVKRVKYRSVELTFDPEEELRPDATYTINFGDAIRDFTAGNVRPYRFVFSTGDYLDSLEVEGVIRDALTNEPVPEVLLMLYDNLADSVVRTERPFYFARTDKDGRYRIQNVKADTFKVFALEDNSSDYLFNQESERIGFPGEFLYLTDSTGTLPDIRFFKPAPKFRLLNKAHPRYGLSKLIYAGPPENIELETNTTFTDFRTETEGDTLRIWYQLDTARSWELYARYDTLIDTISVPAGNRTQFLNNNQPTPLSNRGPTAHNPNKPLQITYNQPLRDIDTSLIRVYRDTSRQLVTGRWTIDSSDQRSLLLQLPWQESMPYELELMPGAVTGFYGTSSDTLLYSIRTAQRKDFGSLNVSLTGLDTTLAYTFELFLSGKVQDEQFFGDTDSWSKLYPSLRPGKYEIRIVEDRDRNGRWTPGDYDSRTQPERIFIRPLEELRANWEVQADVPVEFPE